MTTQMNPMSEEYWLVDQAEVDQIFARLQQIAPRAVKLYSRPLNQRQLQQLQNVLAFWEREEAKTVASMKRILGMNPKTQG